METMLWLLIFTGQIWAVVIMFWWHKKAPNWLRIWIWISLIAMLLAVIWLTME